MKRIKGFVVAYNENKDSPCEYIEKPGSVVQGIEVGDWLKLDTQDKNTFVLRVGGLRLNITVKGKDETDIKVERMYRDVGTVSIVIPKF